MLIRPVTSTYTKNCDLPACRSSRQSPRSTRAGHWKTDRVKKRPVATALKSSTGVATACLCNDGSVRDFQRHSTQFTPGKNFPATGGFGPWLITRDEVGDIRNSTLTTRLNGTVVQHARLDDLIFDIPALIEYCSTFTELVPGDVIVTGTPGGVGAARKPPLWMQPGDVVEVDISNVGVLRNPVAQEP